MMSKRQNKELDFLEYIAAKSGCLYLSDLHNPENLLFVQCAVSQIDPSVYSLEEWNEAARYITQEAVAFETEEQALNYIMCSRQLGKTGTDGK